MIDIKGKMLKVKVTADVLSIYAQYRPEVGKVYDAEWGESRKNVKEYCIIDILDKRIILRKGEFEIVGGQNG